VDHEISSDLTRLSCARRVAVTGDPNMDIPVRLCHADDEHGGLRDERKNISDNRRKCV